MTGGDQQTRGVRTTEPSRAGDDRTSGIDAVIFDLDGVVTRTVRLHAGAWKEVFDDLLRRRARAGGEAFRPFDPQWDYFVHLAGRPRHEGVRGFLAARGVQLPEGQPDDGPEVETAYGLGRRKDALFERRLRQEGVEVFPSTLALIRALRERGIKTGVVTASRYGRELLAAAGIEELFGARVDGVDVDRLGLPGEPDPAAFLRCAGMLGVAPGRTAVIEDSATGVEAARRGRFGLVIGVNRDGNRDALAVRGADLVVDDLGEIDVDGLESRLRATQEGLAWRIEQEGFDPAREHAVESIFTLGNGYLGVRGTLNSPVPSSQGDLFIAGIYDRKWPAEPYSEVEFLHLGHSDYPYTELVSLPFPFRMTLSVAGEPLDMTGDRWRAHRRVLDLHEGVLYTDTDFETGSDRRTTVRGRRCASAADRHLLLQEITVVLENHSAILELNASLTDPDLPTQHPHLVAHVIDNADPTLEVHRFTTRGSGYEICIASRTTLLGRNGDAVRWRMQGDIGETFIFRRYVAIFTSRDAAEPQVAAIEHVHAQRWEDFESALAAHAARWHEVWDCADVRIPGRPGTEQALRFATYHLCGTADRDPRISVGARALTGRAYEGHIFWDVEIFMLPFYLHTCPEVARSLLLYRHHTLDGARRRAREHGFQGACYAWESTVTGDDVTPVAILLKTTHKKIPIFTGEQQIHVTADVAYGVWRYFEATQDADFLRDAGAEIIVDTARFWASRVVRDGEAYHIRGVVGPDEYHHGVDDNAYTNWMARFNLEKAVWVAQWMQREQPGAWGGLVERCGLTSDAVGEWTQVARRLYCPMPNRDGVIEQFEGFFDLDDYPLPREERYQAPINRLFDWDKINGLKLIKQADVLMLPLLFPEAFSREVVAASYRYYEPMTDHGSSLSPSIHAAIAARLGLMDDAERYWRQALWLDLSNLMGNSVLGVHPACMGGTWQALVFGFLGVRFTDAGPVPDPDAASRLPRNWRSVAMKLAWRGRRYPVEVEKSRGIG